MIKNFNRQ